MFVNF